MCDWDNEETEENDDSVALVTCPNCETEFYEESIRCPNCGDYVTPDTSIWSGRSWWWIILGVLGIGAVIAILARGG